MFKYICQRIIIMPIILIAASVLIFLMINLTPYDPATQLLPADYTQEQLADLHAELGLDLKDSMGLTYMFVTHDLSVVKHISDEILVLYLGTMFEKAESDRLFENPLHPYTKALLSAIPVPDASYKGKEATVMQGEVTSPINPPDGCRFARRCPFASERCRQENPTYKEVEPNHFVACHQYD